MFGCLDGEIAVAHQRDVEYERTHFDLGSSFQHCQRLMSYAGPLLQEAIANDLVHIIMPSEQHAPRFVYTDKAKKIIADSAAHEQADLERERREIEGTDPRTLREEIDDIDAAEAWEEQRGHR